MTGIGRVPGIICATGKLFPTNRPSEKVMLDYLSTLLEDLVYYDPINISFADTHKPDLFILYIIVLCILYIFLVNNMK